MTYKNTCHSVSFHHRISFCHTESIHFCLVFQTEAEEEVLNRKRSKKAQKKYEERRKLAKVSQQLEEQFATGRLLGEFLLRGKMG